MVSKQSRLFEDLSRVREISDRGDRVAALLAARQVVADFPGEAASHQLLGIELASQSLFSEAEQELKSALQLSVPPNFLIRVQLGGIQAIAGRFAEANENFESVLQGDANNPIALFGLGLVADRQNRGVDAISYYEAAVRTYQSKIPVALAVNLGRLYNRKGDFSATVQLIGGQAAGITDPDFHMVLGSAYLAMDRRNEAASEAKLAITHGAQLDRILLWAADLYRRLGDFPSSLDAISRLSSAVKGEAVFQEAETLSASGDVENALVKYRQASLSKSNRWLAESRIVSLSLSHDHGDQAIESYHSLLQGSDVPAAAYDAAGLAFQKKNRFMEAERLFQEAAKRFPSDPSPLYRLGLLFSAMGRFDEAIAVTKKLLVLRPKNEPGERLLSLTYLRSGKPAEAIVEARVVAAANTTNADGELFLATVLTQAGKPAEAIVAYRAALRRNPSDLAAMNNLAVLLDQTNQRKEAIMVARQAVALSFQPNADILDTLGWLLVEDGTIPEGRDFLAKAAKLKPTDPSIRYHLGIALEKSGEVALAKEEINHALSQTGTFPERADATTALSRLK